MWPCTSGGDADEVDHNLGYNDGTIYDCEEDK